MSHNKCNHSFIQQLNLSAVFQVPMNFIRRLISLSIKVYYRLSIVSEIIYATPTFHMSVILFRLIVIDSLKTH